MPPFVRASLDVRAVRNWADSTVLFTSNSSFSLMSLPPAKARARGVSMGMP